MPYKISIIIPCYNVEEYISQCLESVIKQTYENIEIICINDGSTDHTAQILDKYAERDPRITVVTQKNAGISAARNTGIQNSSGEFIMFVDADDWIEGNAIEITAENTKVDLFCFSYNRILKNKINPRVLNLNGDYEGEIIQMRMVGLVRNELCDPSQTDSLVPVWGKRYKTAIIKENDIQFIDTKIIGNEDALFNIQYLAFAETVKIVDKPLYNYRRTNSTSFTSSYKPELFEKWKVLYDKIGESIKGKNGDFNAALQNRICLSIIGLGLNEIFSKKSNREKAKRLTEILSDPLYEKAYSKLALKYFPLHWKMFFYFAKNKMTTPLLWMLKIIKLKISK